MERPGSNEGEECTDVFQSILYRCACEAPSRTTLEFRNGLIEGSFLPSDYVSWRAVSPCALIDKISKVLNLATFI
jgi:hypothetical protein